MKKVSFIDKVLFFLNFKDIDDEITREGNTKNNSIVTWIFCFIFIVPSIIWVDIWADNHLRSFKIIVALIILFILIELNYYLAVLKHKKDDDEK